MQFLDSLTKSFAAEGQVRAPNGIATDATKESAMDLKLPLSRNLCCIDRGRILEILRVPFVIFRSIGSVRYSDGLHRGAVFDNRTDLGVTRASWASCEEVSVLLDDAVVMCLV